MESRIIQQFIALIISALALTTACSTTCKDRDTRKPDKIITDILFISGTVVAVDHNSRMATLRDKTGSYVTFRVDRRVGNFDKIQKGSMVVASYVESIGIRIIAPGMIEGDLGKKSAVTVDVGLKGGKPYCVTAKIIELRGVVDSINHAFRYMAVKGRKGNIISFRVGRSIERLENVRKGDIVVIYYTEAVAILLEEISPNKPAPEHL